MPRQHLLLHSGEDTIHGPQREKKDMTPKDKGRNFWFYHKWHLLIGLGLVLLIAFFVRDFFNREDPDYEIGLLVKKGYLEDSILMLESYLEEKGTDLNNDGQVAVRINQYVVATDIADEYSISLSQQPEGNASESEEDILSAVSSYVDPYTQMASFVRFSGDLQNDTCMIYFVGEDCIDYFQGTYHLFASSDYSNPDMEATDATGVGSQWEEYAYLEGLTLLVETFSGEGDDMFLDVTERFRELRVCIRDFDQLTNKGDQGIVDYYYANRDFLESWKTE